MISIILTPEQKDQMRNDGSLEIRDADGGRIAVLHWEDTPEFLHELKKKIEGSRGQPKVSGKQVLAHLAALEREWNRTGGFTPGEAVRMVEQMRREEAR